MAIWTSNFKNAGNNPNAVAIARGLPRIKGGWHGHRYRALEPTQELLNTWKQGAVESEWSRRFNEEILAKLNPKKVYEDLLKLSSDPILLCWEPPGQFCHRVLVANWLSRELLIEVREWDPKIVNSPSMFSKPA